MSSIGKMGITLVSLVLSWSLGRLLETENYLTEIVTRLSLLKLRVD